MVVEARRLVDAEDCQLPLEVRQLLDNFGYDEAAFYVYGGIPYNEWKAGHQKKSTEEQIRKYELAKPLFAQHDKSLLEKPVAGTGKGVRIAAATPAASKEVNGQQAPRLASSVCCQDVDAGGGGKASTAAASQDHAQQKRFDVKTSSSNIDSKNNRPIGAYVPPPMPEFASPVIRVGVLTVSDRASKDQYETGDLSGPAVVDAVARQVAENGGGGVAVVEKLQVETTTSIVPDNEEAIRSQIRTWCDNDGGQSTTMDIILTTGGTGMSPRDVTPEATKDVLDAECPGLMSFVTTECSRIQPLSSLSRGTAGFRNRTLVANLPGNPRGVIEIVPILFPLLLAALSDLREE